MPFSGLQHAVFRASICRFQGFNMPFSGLQHAVFKASTCRFSNRKTACFVIGSWPGWSDDGEGDAADLLVDVQRVDVCHAADEVNDCHEARLQVGGVNIVLAADTPDELL